MLEAIKSIVELLGVVLFMGGIIYLFKAFKREQQAKVIPFNNTDREAVYKAQKDLELGIEEARKRFAVKREEYKKKLQEELENKQ